MSLESKLIQKLLYFIPFVCSYATVVELFWFDREKGGSFTQFISAASL